MNPVNDLFVSPGSEGLALFDDNGDPTSRTVVVSDSRLLDAGSERNQAPAMGPVQAPRQDQADTSAAEGVVAPYRDSTRALPQPADFVDVSVSASGETLTVTVQVLESDVITTPLSGVYYASHNDDFSVFDPTGGNSATSGLETLAEDGAAGDYLASLPNPGADGGVKSKFAVTSPDGIAGDEPIAPGEAYSFTVEPDSDRNRLSVVSMIIPSNDAFLSTGTAGVELMDSDSNLRNEGDVQADLEQALGAWEAGTEVNQPGAAGPDQATGPDLSGGQSAAGQGPEEGDGAIRESQGLYTYPRLGDLLEITIEPTGNRATLSPEGPDRRCGTESASLSPAPAGPGGAAARKPAQFHSVGPDADHHRHDQADFAFEAETFGHGVFVRFSPRVDSVGGTVRESDENSHPPSDASPPTPVSPSFGSWRSESVSSSDCSAAGGSGAPLELIIDTLHERFPETRLISRGAPGVSTAEGWDPKRRVVAKGEWSDGEPNFRYPVTPPGREESTP